MEGTRKLRTLKLKLYQLHGKSTYGWKKGLYPSLLFFSITIFYVLATLLSSIGIYLIGWLPKISEKFGNY